MGTQIERLAAYKAAIADQNPSAPIRIRLSDADALALITETGTSSLRHPEATEKALEPLTTALSTQTAAAASLATAVKAADLSAASTAAGAMAAADKAVNEAAKSFWDAIHGEEINGVEILRKVS